MNQRLSLQQRLGQSLTMTPQLRQAIRLLQYSNLELAAYLEEQLNENPLLERGEGPAGEDSYSGDTPFSDGERDRATTPGGRWPGTLAGKPTPE